MSYLKHCSIAFIIIASVLAFPHNYDCFYNCSPWRKNGVQLFVTNTQTVVTKTTAVNTHARNLANIPTDPYNPNLIARRGKTGYDRKTGKMYYPPRISVNPLSVYGMAKPSHLKPKHRKPGPPSTRYRRPTNPYSIQPSYGANPTYSRQPEYPNYGVDPIGYSPYFAPDYGMDYYGYELPGVNNRNYAPPIGQRPTFSECVFCNFFGDVVDSKITGKKTLPCFGRRPAWAIL